MSDLGTLGGAYSAAHAINAAGQVGAFQVLRARLPNTPSIAIATFRRKIREVRKAASVGQATHQKLVEW